MRPTVAPHRTTLPIVLILCIGAIPVSAQGTTSPESGRAPATRAEETTKSSGWSLRPVVEITSEYDDNVFLLKDSKKTDVGSPSAGELVSGRYADMAGASDVITTIRATTELRDTGAFGRDIEFRPEIGFDAYARNARRRNVGLALAVEQQLPHGSRARLGASLTPSYFARNYLSDAIDADGNGTISSAERRYEPGTYRESELTADYRVRLEKATKEHPFGAALQVGAGYYSRAHQAPFAGRDVGGPTADVRILTSVSRRVDVDLIYDFASLSATPTPTAMVVDEPAVGQDLNGNGNATDANVRVVGPLDRSRTEHSLGARVGVDLRHHMQLGLDVERRSRHFSSSDPTDYANYGRRDVRSQLGAEFVLGVGPRMDLVARGLVSAQKLERGSDGGLGEMDDYSRHRLALGMRYGF